MVSRCDIITRGNRSKNQTILLKQMNRCREENEASKTNKQTFERKKFKLKNEVETNYVPKLRDLV